MALTALASCGDAACARIASPDQKTNGLDVVTKQVETHLAMREVAEEFILFVEELLEEETIEGKSEVQSLYFHFRSYLVQVKKSNKIKLLLKKIKAKHKLAKADELLKKL